MKDPGKSMSGKEIEKPIKVEFVDMPRLYHYNDALCDEFFGALAGTEKYEVFQ